MERIWLSHHHPLHDDHQIVLVNDDGHDHLTGKSSELSPLGRPWLSLPPLQAC